MCSATSKKRDDTRNKPHEAQRRWLADGGAPVGNKAARGAAGSGQEEGRERGSYVTREWRWKIYTGCAIIISA